MYASKETQGLVENGGSRDGGLRLVDKGYSREQGEVNAAVQSMRRGPRLS